MAGLRRKLRQEDEGKIPESELVFERAFLIRT